CPPRVKSVPSPLCHSFSEGTTCRSETSASCGGGGAAVAGTAAPARPASSAGAARREDSRRVCTGSLPLETQALSALRSDGVDPVELRRRRERCVRFALVPPCGRGDVLPQWPVALEALLGAGEPERLDRHPEPAGEADRVGQVPAVQTEPQLAVVELVRGDHLRHAQVRRAVGLVPGPVRVLEGPGPAEVVLGAGATDGGEVLVVVVEVELDLPL